MSANRDRRPAGPELALGLRIIRVVAVQGRHVVAMDRPVWPASRSCQAGVGVLGARAANMRIVWAGAIAARVNPAGERWLHREADVWSGSVLRLRAIDDHYRRR
jgi:hypothetical protein